MHEGATRSARRRIASHDAIWLQDSSTNPMIINSVCVLDRAGLEEVRALWRERVLEGDSGERFARLRHRAVREGGRAFWERDPAFDVARHVVPAPEDVVEGRAGLEALVGRIARDPLPDDRPPWQVLVVRDCGHGASAMIVRLHHVLGDGMGFLPVLFSLLDDVDDGNDGNDGARAARRAAAGRWRRAVAAPFAMPWLVLRRALARPDRSALHGPPLSGDKRVAWSRPVELDAIHVARRALGATVNDVLTAAVGGGVRRVLEEAGSPLVADVRAFVPVNVRSAADEPRLENRFATVVLRVPVASDGALARLRLTKRAMDRVKASVEPLAMYLAVRAALGLLPDGASRRLVDHIANRCTMVLTNVPGPRGTLHMAGRAVRGLVFWVPQRADIGLGVSLFSHGGQLDIGVMSDAAVLEEPRRLVDAIEREIGEIARLAPAG